MTGTTPKSRIQMYSPAAAGCPGELRSASAWHSERPLLCSGHDPQPQAGLVWCVPASLAAPRLAAAALAAAAHRIRWGPWGQAAVLASYGQGMYTCDSCKLTWLKIWRPVLVFLSCWRLADQQLGHDAVSPSWCSRSGRIISAARSYAMHPWPGQCQDGLDWPHTPHLQTWPPTPWSPAASNSVWWWCVSRYVTSLCMHDEACTNACMFIPSRCSGCPACTGYQSHLQKCQLGAVQVHHIASPQLLYGCAQPLLALSLWSRGFAGW